MSAPGSGNKWQNAKTTTSDMLTLDVRYLHREGLLVPGRCSGVEWLLNGKVIGAINIRAENKCVLLDYHTRQPGSDWEEQQYPVALAWTACHFGGQRPWFLCPCCERRVAILYGGPNFACRHCHQLVYDSTKEELYLRIDRRALKIRGRLGWHDEYGPKPKGMHWRTFERLMQEYRRLDKASWMAAAEKFKKKQ